MEWFDKDSVRIRVNNSAEVVNPFKNEGVDKYEKPKKPCPSTSTHMW